MPLGACCGLAAPQSQPLWTAHCLAEGIAGLEPQFQVRRDDNERVFEQLRLSHDEAQERYRRVFTLPAVFTKEAPSF